MVDYDLKIIRPDAILTTAYVVGAELEDLERHNQIMLFLEFTKGQLTSFQLKIEFSDDGITYYQHTFESISGGVNTCSPGVYSFTPSGDQNFMLAVPVKCSKIRISVKGTGTVTSSSLRVRAAIGKA